MRRMVISLMLVFTLVANVFAADYSENYIFIHNLVDCLERLQSAARYSIEDAEYESLLPNLHKQISYFRDAKIFIKDWLDSKNMAIKATAAGMYVDISEIEDAAKSLINILSAPTLEDIPDISKHCSQIGFAWNKVFQSSGFALWVIAQPAKSKDPKGKIPFIISDKERQDLIKYLNKIFGRDFREYEQLLSQKDKGEISEFKLTIPVWSALHLRSLLTQETYEQAEREED